MSDKVALRNDALDSYHSDHVVDAMKKFAELAKMAESPEEKADVQLWIASSHRKLRHFNEALEILDDVEAEDLKITPRMYNRTLLIRADIFSDMCRFEDAFEIYTKLLNFTSSYDDMYYLDLRIEETLHQYEFFKEHGPLDEWKARLFEKIHNALHPPAPELITDTLSQNSMDLSNAAEVTRLLEETLLETGSFSPTHLVLEDILLLIVPELSCYILPREYQVIPFRFESNGKTWRGILIDRDVTNPTVPDDPFLVEEEVLMLGNNLRDQLGWESARMIDPWYSFDNVPEPLSCGAGSCFLFEE